MQSFVSSESHNVNCNCHSWLYNLVSLISYYYLDFLVQSLGIGSLKAPVLGPLGPPICLPVKVLDTSQDCNETYKILEFWF